MLGNAIELIILHSINDQINTLYTLTLQNAVCQVYLNKSGKRKEKEKAEPWISLNFPLRQEFQGCFLCHVMSRENSSQEPGA